MIEINWNPDSTELKKFGFWIMILGGSAAGIVYLNGLPKVSLGILTFSILAGLSGLSGTVVAKPFYAFWMMISMMMGLVISPIIFFCLYYLFISPYAIFLKLIGRDRLGLKKRDQASYWVDITPVKDKKRYLRQF